MNWPPQRPVTPLAILVSGGLDSAILLGEAVRVYPIVHPIYIRTGSRWETVELGHLQRFLDAVQTPALRPLQILDQPVADLYGSHWSLSGDYVPGADTPDEAVFLPGRNVLLLAKSMLWCHLNAVPEIALAPLESNPFPDATTAFFQAFAQVLNMAVEGTVAISRPYAQLHKIDVIRRGRGLPLEQTFSCIQPIQGLHCGRCNKCAERQNGFAAAEMTDPTSYAS